MYTPSILNLPGSVIKYQIIIRLNRPRDYCNFRATCGQIRAYCAQKCIVGANGEERSLDDYFIALHHYIVVTLASTLIKSSSAVSAMFIMKKMKDDMGDCFGGYSADPAKDDNSLGEIWLNKGSHVYMMNWIYEHLLAATRDHVPSMVFVMASLRSDFLTFVKSAWFSEAGPKMSDLIISWIINECQIDKEPVLKTQGEKIGPKVSEFIYRHCNDENVKARLVNSESFWRNRQSNGAKCPVDMSEITSANIDYIAKYTGLNRGHIRVPMKLGMISAEAIPCLVDRFWPDNEKVDVIIDLIREGRTITRPRLIRYLNNCIVSQKTQGKNAIKMSYRQVLELIDVLTTFRYRLIQRECVLVADIINEVNYEFSPADLQDIKVYGEMCCIIKAILIHTSRPDKLLHWINDVRTALAFMIAFGRGQRSVFAEGHGHLPAIDYNLYNIVALMEHKPFAQLQRKSRHHGPLSRKDAEILDKLLKTIHDDIDGEMFKVIKAIFTSTGRYQKYRDKMGLELSSCPQNVYSNIAFTRVFSGWIIGTMFDNIDHVNIARINHYYLGLFQLYPWYCVQIAARLRRECGGLCHVSYTGFDKKRPPSLIEKRRYFINEIIGSLLVKLMSPEVFIHLHRNLYI